VNGSSFISAKGGTCHSLGWSSMASVNCGTEILAHLLNLQIIGVPTDVVTARMESDRRPHAKRFRNHAHRYFCQRRSGANGTVHRKANNRLFPPAIALVLACHGHLSVRQQDQQPPHSSAAALPVQIKGQVMHVHSLCLSDFGQSSIGLDAIFYKQRRVPPKLRILRPSLVNCRS
jgi:hypothetical protein